MYKLVRFLKPYKKEFILGPLFKLAEAVLEILLPTLMALIIDNGVNTADKNYIFIIGGLMLVCTTIGLICALLCQFMASRASQGVGTDIRNSIFEHIGAFSHKEIDKFGTASLINRTTSDVNQVQSAVAMLIRLVIRAPFLCIGGAAMAIIIDAKLSLILFISIPIFIIVLYLIMKKTIPMYRIVQQKLDNIALILRQNLSGVRVIRAFSAVEKEKVNFKSSTQDYYNMAVKVGKIASLTNPATTLIMNLAIIAVLWFGGIRVNLGAMTQGQIIAYINYLTLILNALIVVANLVVLFTKASASASRINEIFETNPSIQDSHTKIHESLNSPIIEFKNVSFAYNDNSEYAIENLSFKVFKGQFIGIIGGTGSGKSTIVNLIPRFYDVTKGSIFINGVNIKDYSQQNLRNKIGIVPQHAVLFSGTIKNNIRWGKKDATDGQIKQAAYIAQASDFIENLKDKYDTQISQGGINFSGGQKQRLTIARAIVKNPDILILDDSSSALDYATDSALRKALKAITQTTIMISQRASSLTGADLIIVLDDGKVAGIGKHDELIKNCDVYKEICLSQVQEENQ